MSVGRAGAGKIRGLLLEDISGRTIYFRPFHSETWRSCSEGDVLAPLESLMIVGSQRPLSDRIGLPSLVIVDTLP